MWRDSPAFLFLIVFSDENRAGCDDRLNEKKTNKGGRRRKGHGLAADTMLTFLSLPPRSHDTKPIKKVNHSLPMVLAEVDMLLPGGRQNRVHPYWVDFLWNCGEIRGFPRNYAFLGLYEFINRFVKFNYLSAWGEQCEKFERPIGLPHYFMRRYYFRFMYEEHVFWMIELLSQLRRWTLEHRNGWYCAP